MRINVRTFTEHSAVVVVDHYTPILELKKKVARDIRIPATQQWIVFKGVVLRDDKTIGCYPLLGDGAVVHSIQMSPKKLQDMAQNAKGDGPPEPTRNYL